MQYGNNPEGDPAVLGELAAEVTAQPLTARSVVASTLLGTAGLALPVRALVRAGELFGVAEGTTRVALSRMTAAGEVEAEPGRYRLAGSLVSRSQAQEASRRPIRADWSGQWLLGVITADRRPPPERAALRAALKRLRLAEWREGVWTRPDNLLPPRLEGSGRGLASWEDLGEGRGQCSWLSVRLESLSDFELAARLWDLEGWRGQANRLEAGLRRSKAYLDAGDASVLRPCFLLAAAVLRHLSVDPLLPDELLPAGWPGGSLRTQYDEYEIALQALLRAWFR